MRHGVISHGILAVSMLLALVLVIRYHADFAGAASIAGGVAVYIARHVRCLTQGVSIMASSNVLTSLLTLFSADPLALEPLAISIVAKGLRAEYPKLPPTFEADFAVVAGIVLTAAKSGVAAYEAVASLVKQIQAAK